MSKIKINISSATPAIAQFSSDGYLVKKRTGGEWTTDIEDPEQTLRFMLTDDPHEAGSILLSPQSVDINDFGIQLYRPDILAHCIITAKIID
jgi:hypothetical protein